MKKRLLQAGLVSLVLSLALLSAGGCAGSGTGAVQTQTESMQTQEENAQTESVQNEKETQLETQEGTEQIADVPGENSEIPEEGGNVSKDEPVQSFTAHTLSGDTFTQEDLAAYDLTLFYFWQTTCNPCVHELPALAAYQAALPGNIQLVTLCFDDYMFPGTADKILEIAGYTGITLTDGDEGFQTFYQNVLYTPTVICFDSQGNMVGEPLVGAPEDLKKAYDRLIGGALDTLGKKDLDG